MKEKTVYILTYGTLMTGERNHHFCRAALNVTPCVIRGILYDTGYGFPAFVPDGDMDVKAELMEIPLTDWPAIDHLEGYPHLYNRIQYQVRLADGRKIWAWVYVMTRIPERAEIIKGGDWRKRI